MWSPFRFASLIVGLAFVTSLGCAAGNDPDGIGGSASASVGGQGVTSTTTTASTSGAGGQGGTGGEGGQGGALSGDIDLCVLNSGGPHDPCQQPEQLDYGVVSSGTTVMRMFRIGNGTQDDVLFKSADVFGSTLIHVKTARYEEDPGNPGTYLRVEMPLPVTRHSGESLWFEAEYTAVGQAGPLPAANVTVKMDLGGSPTASKVVPVVGSESGCPSGQGACDSDPNNGCETNTNTSNDHCGACNTPCQPSGGTGQCVNGQCTLVGCAAPFENCDSDRANGCETNLLNDPLHCGSCLTSCFKANTDSFCNGGNCNIVGCLNDYGDCNLDASDGCETNLGNSMANCGGCNLPCNLAHASEACVPSLTTGLGVCTLLGCDAGYENCNLDPTDGCEIDTDTNVSNCGNCFSPCDYDNAAASCNGGTCQMGACDPDYANCNGFTADGCEAHLTDEVAHCGTCATNCNTVFPNSDVSCNGGACIFAGCDPGFYDIDGSLSNGCEYACTFTSATDTPDDAFTDANCDGIDGDVSQAIFVSPSGANANPGTKAAPVQTIGVALSKAQAQGKTQVIVSNGTYNESVALVSGVSIYGGYSQANGWQRSPLYVANVTSSTVINGRIIALSGTNITTPTTVDSITISSGSTNATSASVYGVYCDTCTALTLKNSTVTTGSAGNGLGGSAGGSGGIGYNGNPGFGVDCDTNGPGGVGGPGGASDCSRNGGNGGKGGADGSNAGSTGGVGVVGTPGGPGGGGGDPGHIGSVGQPGAAGSAGGNGGGAAGGSVLAGFWASSTGGTGNSGTHGNGGGGGGGGGGQGCTFCNDGQGNGGGGGGGGGCAGLAGGGGTGGGGSFAVFLVSSTGIVVSNNLISSGNGGNGGGGGSGGSGGTGGGGASGGTVCPSEVGSGAAGGHGGAGGNGGNGGGGAGGPSYGIYRSGTSVGTAGNTINHGSGGSGGPSAGNAGSVGSSGNTF